MSFSIFKDKLKGLLNKIQSNPILDAGTKSVLNDIPFIGTFLLNLYENSADSTEEKTKQILRILSNLNKMNEKTIKQLSTKLEENQDQILENTNSLNLIQEDTSRISVTLEKLSSNEEKRFQDIKIEFTELRLHITDQTGQIIDKIDEMSLKVTEQIESKIDEAVKKLQNVIHSAPTTITKSNQNSLLHSEGFSEARELVTVLLNDPRFPDHKRTFNTIRTTVTIFSDDELRQILLYSGAIRFGTDLNELWGLATKTISLSKFSQQDLDIVYDDMKNNPEKVPEHSLKIILKDSKFPQGIRSFTQIQKYFKGFSEKQLRIFLLKIQAHGMSNDKFKL